MNEEQLKQIAEETYHFINNKGVSFICYMWNIESDVGGGCQSADADIGDAMVVIARIVRHFNLDPDKLAIALREARLKMEEN